MFQPDFQNLADILARQKPSRPTLFEYFMNEGLLCAFAGQQLSDDDDSLEHIRILIKAFVNAGYDYVLLPSWNLDGFKFWQREPLVFPTRAFDTLATRSLNSSAIIVDRASFQSYPWPDPDKEDYSVYQILADELPSDMKIVISGTSGILETAIDLVGYERLCLMTLADEKLVHDIFEAIGSCILRYYEICASYDKVGALMGNDDWGFKTQTLLSPGTLRKFVFPWHKKIVEVCHAAGKYAILHSCGNLELIMDDIIDDMKYDGKHSFEDAICPVEEACAKWGQRIAILGGIDVDYLCAHPSDAIYRRAKQLLDSSRDRGGYALGSGNSIPPYVPFENYVAMIKAARGDDIVYADMQDISV
jgi:uroporphyrinogen decarboxylase